MPSYDEPTTTGYAILGLLTIEPCSAYELATQLTRGWRVFWPRAERGFYTEPKKLVAAGLAKARVEREGLRKRTVYSITAAGRRALRVWLTRASEPPIFESEGLVRMGFSENATPDDVIRAMQSIREGARSISAMGVGVADEYLRGDGLYPQRVHLITVMARFLSEYAQMLERYGVWAQDEVSTWRSTTDPRQFKGTMDELRRAKAIFEEVLAAGSE